MKIYTHPYSYTKEDFLENKKFSCHSWIDNSIIKINDISSIVEKNKSYLNELDLVGKFNSLNYLLDCFIFHQNQHFSSYPKNNNPLYDFHIIAHELILNDAIVMSMDYQKKTFLENLNNYIQSIDEYKWKQNKQFITFETIGFVVSDYKKRNDYLVDLLKDKDNYLNLFLNYFLDENKVKPISLKLKI